MHSSSKALGWAALLTAAHFTEPILHDIKHTLSEKFNIHHVNIQFELQECSDCHHILKQGVIA